MRIEDTFKYNPETGVLTRRWKSGKWREVKQTPDFLGYCCVGFKGNMYKQHRIAFYLMEGRWPSEIDHINKIKSDNRWCNLREATRSQNVANNTAKNVYKRNDNGKWRVQVTKDQKKYYRGSYTCYGQALKEARKLKKELHGEYA